MSSVSSFSPPNSPGPDSDIEGSRSGSPPINIDLSAYMSQTHDMSPQQRIAILRECYEKVKELEHNINEHTPDLLEPTLKEVDRVFQDGTIEEKMNNTEEIILDSHVLRKSSCVVCKCATQLARKLSKYDAYEFADKILQHSKRLSDSGFDENVDWSAFGKEIMSCFKRTPRFGMLLGTLRPIVKKNVVRRKTVKQAPAKVKQPEKVINVDKVEDSVEETVNGIKKLIHRHVKHNKQPLDFFSLVLHPTSYGKTIENILHTSFLIRDGFIKFKIDKDGIPHVDESPSSEKDKTGKTSNSKTQNVQNVLSLNMQQWRALVEAYGIKKPMIDMDSIRSKNK